MTTKSKKRCCLNHHTLYATTIHCMYKYYEHYKYVLRAHSEIKVQHNQLIKYSQ